jgi:transcriptional regulator with XRE-family HTH domain
VGNDVRALVSSDFGTLLRRHRLAAGLSQEALAERARMSTNGIGALERGYRRTPQFETLSLLIGALALSEEQRQEFVAAAASSGEARSRASVTVGPWNQGGGSTFPMALTSFVGRASELSEVAALVRDHRLVTLTGAGGAAKPALHRTLRSRYATPAVMPFVSLDLRRSAIRRWSPPRLPQPLGSKRFLTTRCSRRSLPISRTRRCC